MQFHLLFAGLARDCEDVIERNVASVLSLLSYSHIASLNLFILENGSRDRTREILLRLAHQYSRIQLCLLPSMDAVYPSRVQRIAACRQHLFEIIINKARKNPSPESVIQLYIPVDLDSQIFSSLDKNLFVKAILEFKLLSNCNALFPYSKPYYYDILALRAPKWCSSDCLIALSRFEQYKSHFICRIGLILTIQIPQKHYSFFVKQRRPFPVQSAFGGFGVYRLASVLSAQYFSSTWRPEKYDFENEHVLFNSSIESKFIHNLLCVEAPKSHLAGLPRGPFSVICFLIEGIRLDLFSVIKKLVKCA